MRVAMIGSGYVGLVSGACFSEFGVKVVCVDKDQNKIDMLMRGDMPIFEPGLDSLVENNVKDGRLSFTTDLKSAVSGADAVFIAVGTPTRRGDGHADLSYVYAAAKEIAEAMDGYTVVVTKSTVPVGTGDEVERIIRETRPDADFDVVSNPEFLREGSAIADFTHPDRVVIGTDSERARGVMKALYRPLYLIETPILFTSRTSSELIKYAANTFLATKITFINEIANLCEKVDADVHDVAKGIGLDGRIGRKFLHAGPGYGGSCFPKDVQALVKTSEQIGYDSQILKAVESVNAKQKTKLFELINRHFNGDLAGKTVALWGLSFKPKTDDMREASSRVLMELLWNAGAKVQAFDPEAMEETQRIYGSRADLNLMGTKEAALNGADMLVICTEWQSFRAPDFDLIKAQLSEPVIFDGRNLYDPQRLEDRGISYYAIGRGLSIKQ